VENDAAAPAASDVIETGDTTDGDAATDGDNASTAE